MRLFENIKKKFRKMDLPFDHAQEKLSSEMMKQMSVQFERWDLVHNEIKHDVFKEINRLLNHPSFVQFEMERDSFEKFLTNFFEGKYCVGTNSGTSALQLTLEALDIGQGDEVITTPYSYISTASAIVRTGAKPVFADIERNNTIDPSKIKENITEDTEAILPVHIYGNICRMEEIERIAKDHELDIIEDCSQAHTSTYNKQRLPYGDIGCFSFHTSKITGGMGNGGAVITDRDDIDQKIRKLREPKSEMDESKKITPCYLDAIQSVFIKEKIKRSEAWTEKKRKIANFYSENLSKLVNVPKENDNVKHSYFRYPIETEERDKLSKYLGIRGVETRTDYRTPLHLEGSFKDLKYEKGDFPNTEKTADNVLCLPCHPFMEKNQAKRVVRHIQSFY